MVLFPQCSSYRIAGVCQPGLVAGTSLVSAKPRSMMKAVRFDTDRPSSSERSKSCCHTEYESVIEIRLGFRWTTASLGGFPLDTCRMVSSSVGRQMNPHRGGESQLMS